MSMKSQEGKMISKKTDKTELQHYIHAFVIGGICHMLDGVYQIST